MLVDFLAVVVDAFGAASATVAGATARMKPRMIGAMKRFMASSLVGFCTRSLPEGSIVRQVGCRTGHAPANHQIHSLVARLLRVPTQLVAFAKSPVKESNLRLRFVRARPSH